MNIAVIDIGSNSFHMIIVRANKNGAFSPIERRRKVVRLLQSEGKIKPEDFEKGVKTLREFKSSAEHYNAEIVAIATSALREAENRREFLNAVRKEAGIEIEVIDGKKEAELVFLGATFPFNRQNKNILNIDIGGGSTEITIGKMGKILLAESLNLGAVRLTKMFCEDSIVNEERLNRCTNYLRNALKDIAPEVNETGFEQCFGSGGTVVSLGLMIAANKGIKFRKFENISGFEFSVTDLREIASLIFSKSTPEERAKIKMLDKERADIIPAGAKILTEIFDLLKIKKMSVSLQGLKEGALYDYLKKN